MMKDLKLYTKGFRLFGMSLLWLVLIGLQATMPANIRAGETINIRIFDTVEVENDQVHLADIADIKCQSRETSQKIGAFIIAKAPLPGKTRRIERDYIKFCLKRNGIDLSRIRLKSPPVVEVYRGYVALDKVRIKKSIIEVINNHPQWRQLKVSVKDIQIHSSLIFPKGKISHSVAATENTALTSPMPFSVRINVNGRPYKSIRAWARLEILTRVVVTQRPIGRNRPITMADVTLKEMDAAHLSGSIISELKDVLGKRAKRNIDVHTVLRTDLIEFPPVVKRGDMVLIVARSQGLKVTALGQVRTNGLRGEKIRVVNLDSKKSIFARVMDANTVMVEF
jgi:flagella basal body P-ring formation protein FlgA